MNDDKEQQISLDLDSSKASSKPIDTAEQSTGESLQWVSHPAKRNLIVTSAVSALIIALIIIVYYMTYSVWFAILGAAILIGSLASFYLPTRYRLDPDNIEIKTITQTRVMEWKKYRTWYPDKNGVLLSPFARPTRIENFRGLYIRFAGNRDEVLEFVKNRLGEKEKPEK